MGFFKKEGIDVIDFTILQKKGLLKHEPIDKPEEVIDLTQPKPSSSSSDPFSFLDNPSNSPSAQSFPPSLLNPNLEVQGLRNKIEDVEYKIDRFLDRLDALEARLKEFDSLK